MKRKRRAQRKLMNFNSIQTLKRRRGRPRKNVETIEVHEECPKAQPINYWDECDTTSVKEKLYNYEDIGAEVGRLVEEKQEAYGDSFGNSHKILQVLYPNGILPSQYHDALTLTRIIDKIFRIASNKTAFAESPYRDIAGYGLLGYKKDLEERQRTSN